jgi:hypothetical protein
MYLEGDYGNHERLDFQSCQDLGSKVCSEATAFAEVLRFQAAIQLVEAARQVFASFGL